MPEITYGNLKVAIKDAAVTRAYEEKGDDFEHEFMEAFEKYEQMALKKLFVMVRSPEFWGEKKNSPVASRRA